MRGVTSYQASQHTLVGIEPIPRINKAQWARSHPINVAAGDDFVPTILLDRGEFGLGPLRIDDELERIELLVLLSQPVKRLAAQIH